MSFPTTNLVAGETQHTIGTHTYEWNGTAWDIAGSTTASAIADKADITYVDTSINNLNLSGISAITSNVLMSGNLALANYAVTKNFATVTYTGNGSSQSIATGINSVDFTVSGNGSGFWLDRTTNQVKNDAGTVQASGSCVCNVSKVHIKRRNGTGDNWVLDGLRGEDGQILTNSTAAETTYTNILDGWTTTGFTIGSSTAVCDSGATYVAYQTLYTHIKWGTTNQGKFYVEAYNPVTREGMIYYIGSGIAGHEIPHSVGVLVEYVDNKNLDTTNWWVSQYGTQNGYLNTTNAFSASNVMELNESNITLTLAGGGSNGSNQEHIAYYKAKSETWTIVPYQGSGASGLFIETLDVNGVPRMPRRVTIKSTNYADNWGVLDSERPLDQVLRLNLSNAEADFGTPITFNSNGFTFNDGWSQINGSGNQYIALVEFDTNGNGGDSYFDLPVDDSALNLTSGVLCYTDGIAGNGYELSIEQYTGSIDFTGVADGIVYAYKEKGGSFGFDTVEPVFAGTSARATGGYYFNTKTGKWYNDSDVEQASRAYIAKVLCASETPMDLR